MFPGVTDGMFSNILDGSVNTFPTTASSFDAFLPFSPQDSWTSPLPDFDILERPAIVEGDYFLYQPSTKKVFEASGNVETPPSLQSVYEQSEPPPNGQLRSKINGASPTPGSLSEQCPSRSAPAELAPSDQRLRCGQYQCNKTFVRQCELKYVLSNS